MSEQTVIEREAIKLHETLIAKLETYDITTDSDMFEESETKILLLYLVELLQSDETKFWDFVHHYIFKETI